MCSEQKQHKHCILMYNKMFTDINNEEQKLCPPSKAQVTSCSWCLLKTATVTIYGSFHYQCLCWIYCSATFSKWPFIPLMIFYVTSVITGERKLIQAEGNKLHLEERKKSDPQILKMNLWLIWENFFILCKSLKNVSKLHTHTSFLDSARGKVSAWMVLLSICEDSISATQQLRSDRSKRPKWTNPWRAAALYSSVYPFFSPALSLSAYFLVTHDFPCWLLFEARQWWVY